MEDWKMNNSEVRIGRDGSVSHYVPLSCCVNGTHWPIAAQALTNACSTLPFGRGRAAALMWDDGQPLAVYTEHGGRFDAEHHARIVRDVSTAWEARLGQFYLFAAALEELARRGQVRLAP
jgi:hypothetical protein